MRSDVPHDNALLSDFNAPDLDDLISPIERGLPPIIQPLLLGGFPLFLISFLK